MRHISFYGKNLELEGVTLEKLDIWNKTHREVVNRLRDSLAREMCYDIMIDIDNDMEVKNSAGNLFLAKNNEGYFGYMKISNIWNDEIVLVSVIDERLRGQGLGKNLLNSISDYLLDNNEVSTIKLYVKNKNDICVGLVKSCGFEKTGDSSERVSVYCKSIKM